MLQCAPARIAALLLLTSLIVACAVRSDSFMEAEPASSREALSGPETAIDPDIYPVPIPSGDSGARVVFGGTNYLVVWRGGTTEALYAARVSESGMPLDPVAIRIGTAGQGVSDIDVAFNGQEYLVVWTDQLLRVRCSRISMTGTVLDPKSVLVGGTGARTPAVSSDGNNFMLVWTELTQNIDTIYAARVDASGVMLDPGGVALVPGHDPEIAFDGTSYLLAFRTVPAGVHGLRVAGDTTPIGQAFPISGPATADEREPDIAFAPALNSFLVVWRTGGGVVYGRRVRSDGLVLGTSEVRLSPSDNSWCPHVAWGAAQTGWIVTWNGAEVYAARVDAEGTPAAVTQVRLSPAKLGMPAVATSGAGALVVWHEAADSFDILATRISLAGTVLDAQPTLVSTTNNLQTSPAAGFDGTSNLVLWVDERAGGDIRGARVDQAGNVMDSSPIVVANTPDRESAPAITFNGMDYVAVWSRAVGAASEIRGTRISRAGVVRDPTGILISPATLQGNPAVAVLASDVLVAWQAQGPESTDILGKRVNDQGIVLDAAPIGIGTGSNEQTDPAASSDGKNYFVVWRELRPGSEMRAARVSAAGAVLDPAGLGFDIHPPLGQAEPDVAFGGEGYLLVWRMTTVQRIYGMRVSIEGEGIGSAFQLSGEDAFFPAVIHDGYKFFAAWQRSEHGRPFDIQGARIGNSTEPAALLTAYRGGDSLVALAPRGPGKALIAYQKQYDAATMRGPRVFFKTQELGLPGARCASDEECATGFCVVGVCCLTMCVGNCSTCAPATGLCSPDDSMCAGSCERCESADGGFSCMRVDACNGECDGCDSGLMDQWIEETGYDGPMEAEDSESGNDTGDAAADPDGADAADGSAGSPEAAVESGPEAAVLDSAFDSGAEAPSHDVAVEFGPEAAALDSAIDPGPETDQVDNAPGEQQGCACTSSGQPPRRAELILAGLVALILLARRTCGQPLRT